MKIQNQEIVKTYYIAVDQFKDLSYSSSILYSQQKNKNNSLALNSKNYEFISKKLFYECNINCDVEIQQKYISLEMLKYYKNFNKDFSIKYELQSDFDIKSREISYLSNYFENNLYLKNMVINENN